MTGWAATRASGEHGDGGEGAGLELLLRNQREGPQALALDLDGDEILTLKDLVLFSQRLEGAAP